MSPSLIANMVHSWASLPSRWDLQDVQAAISITITLLSTFAIFVFIRICWQVAARKVAQNRGVQLPALLSLNTLSDVIDALFFLRGRLFSRQHLAILGQCLVVTILTIVAIFSGPLARYSCRSSLVAKSQDVQGYIASRGMNDLILNDLEWTRVWNRLDKAGFPHDQLLDYLPDITTDWRYEADQWNSSWHLSCENTPSTPMTIRSVADCSSFYTTFPDLEPAFNWSKWGAYNDYAAFHSGDYYRDMTMFLYAYHKGDNVTEDDTTTYRTMNLSIVNIQIHNLRRIPDTEDCEFLNATAERASFTRVDCLLTRNQHVRDPYQVAFPDVDDDFAGDLTNAYVQHYNAAMVRKSAAHQALSVVEPRDLIRFLQSYMIAKDTVSRELVNRTMTVEIPRSQVSTIFLILACVSTLVLLVGSLYIGIFYLRHQHTVMSTPQSKVDWMLQSIQNRSGVDSRGQARHSVLTSETTALSSMPSTKRKRSDFSSATYGTPATRTTSSTSSTPSLARYSSLKLTPSQSFTSSLQDYNPYTVGLGIEEDEEPLVRPSHSYNLNVLDAYSPEHQNAKYRLLSQSSVTKTPSLIHHH